MANIMLTNRCNLNCPYCFAHEFVDNAKSTSDITMQQFHKILNFILLDGTDRHVGLIGGEPSIHPLFGEFLEILTNDSRIDYITVYTNGISIQKYIYQLSQNKIRLLINCNSPLITGEKKFNQLVENIKALVEKKAYITLGINVYNPNFDVTYMLQLLDLFQNPKLRFSLSVPQYAETTINPLENFRKMKHMVLSLFKQLKDRKIIPFFDCNFFPPCLFTAEETSLFNEWGADNPLLTLKSRSISCAPVIDIMPDGTAVRCFGLSRYTKENIKDFATITDLRRYYMRTVDAFAMNCYYDSTCSDCYKFKTAKCTSGCMAYKIKKIISLRDIVNKNNISDYEK